MATTTITLDASDVDFFTMADAKLQESKKTAAVFTNAVNANQAIVTRLLKKLCTAHQLDIKNFSDFSLDKATGVLTLTPKVTP